MSCTMTNGRTMFPSDVAFVSRACFVVLYCRQSSILFSLFLLELIDPLRVHFLLFIDEKINPRPIFIYRRRIIQVRTRFVL